MRTRARRRWAKLRVARIEGDLWMAYRDGQRRAVLGLITQHRPPSAKRSGEYLVDCGDGGRRVVRAASVEDAAGVVWGRNP